MTLTEQINVDLKAAMKSGDPIRLNTVRSIRAQIIEMGKRGTGTSLTPDEETSVLLAAAKKRKEAIEMYEQAKRMELVEQEQKELAIIQSYLPKQMTRTDAEAVVIRIVAEAGASTVKDLGKVMPLAMKELKGKIDGKIVQEIVKQKLEVDRMFFDILIMPPLILTALLGVRDGIVRKSVSILATIAALILGQLYMRDVGRFLVENMGVKPSDGPMRGFLTIFIAIVLLQGLFYRLVAKAYKIGGLADRIVGGVLGLAQGALFMSGILMIYALEGPPSRETTRESRLYKPIVNIAPMVVDFLTTVGPDATEELKKMGTPNVPSGSKEIQQRGRALKDSLFERQKEVIDGARRPARR